MTQRLWPHGQEKYPFDTYWEILAIDHLCFSHIDFFAYWDFRHTTHFCILHSLKVDDSTQGVSPSQSTSFPGIGVSLLQWLIIGNGGQLCLINPVSRCVARFSMEKPILAFLTIHKRTSCIMETCGDGREKRWSERESWLVGQFHWFDHDVTDRPALTFHALIYFSVFYPFVWVVVYT